MPTYQRLARAIQQAVMAKVVDGETEVMKKFVSADLGGDAELRKFQDTLDSNEGRGSAAGAMQEVAESKGQCSGERHISGERGYLGGKKAMNSFQRDAVEDNVSQL